MEKNNLERNNNTYKMNKNSEIAGLELELVSPEKIRG
jgi:hypothetical protein